MINLFSAIKENRFYTKIEASELLFVEYTCMMEETKLGIWSQNNYFAFITSGKKIWKSIYNSYEANEGDILFIKKGANLTHQFFDGGFCAIFIFIPDDFIKELLQRNKHLLEPRKKAVLNQDAVLRIDSDELMESYYHSIQLYLSLSEKPNELLIKHKFEELVLSLFSSKRHQHLTDYFISLLQSQEFQMNRIMEENFAYNLSLENYAQLCHMSLSRFKMFFRKHYNTTPGRWLKQKKLELSLHYLLNSDVTIAQITLECGFEDPSHFIRIFKQKYHVTPLQYRQRHLNQTAAKV